MPDIILAADEVAAATLVHDAETTLGTLADSGTGSLGPFTASWSANAFFSNGTVDLIPSNIIRIADCQMNYSLGFTFGFDLSDFLPDFCIPEICLDLGFFEICTPEICIDWPTISIPLSFSDVLEFTADFTLDVHLSGSDWLIDIVIIGIPFLQIGPTAVAILVALGTAVGLALAAVPFIGPFLAATVVAIIAAIGIAGVTGFLGPILTPFVSGLRFNIYKQSQLFQVLPAVLPLDPAVNVNLDTITAEVIASDEDELVITVDISA